MSTLINGLKRNYKKLYFVVVIKQFLNGCINLIRRNSIASPNTKEYEIKREYQLKTETPPKIVHRLRKIDMHDKAERQPAIAINR